MRVGAVDDVPLGTLKAVDANGTALVLANVDGVICALQDRCSHEEYPLSDGELDGGHIAGALRESLRRNVAKVFRRPDPGPFDVAKLMPVAYVVAGIFICFTVLVLIADVVNPVRIS